MDTAYIHHRPPHGDCLPLSASSIPAPSSSSLDLSHLMQYPTASYSLAPECHLLLSPVSTAASPPAHHMMEPSVAVTEPPLSHPSTPTLHSGKMAYPHWNPPFEMSLGPAPKDDVMMPHDFYMQQRRTPNPAFYLNSRTSDDVNNNQSLLHQPASYFFPIQQLGGSCDGTMQNIHALSNESPTTLESCWGVCTNRQDSPRQDLSRKRIRLNHDISTDPKMADQEAHGSETHEKKLNKQDKESDVGQLAQSHHDDGEEIKTSKKTSSKKSIMARASTVDANDHKNCLGQESPPKLKETCPKEERVIFESRWNHRDKKGQDMWDSIQEDYYRAFAKRQGKETLQMKLSRGRAKYIDWLEEDVSEDEEELLIQAWQMTEIERYKTVRDNFLKLGGSRNMMLSANDIEVKVVADLGLEEAIYVEPVNDVHIRRRCRYISGKKKRKADGQSVQEVGISYCGPSLINRVVDEDVVISQVLASQAKNRAGLLISNNGRRRKGPKLHSESTRVKAE